MSNGPLVAQGGISGEVFRRADHGIGTQRPSYLEMLSLEVLVMVHSILASVDLSLVCHMRLEAGHPGWAIIRYPFDVRGTPEYVFSTFIANQCFWSGVRRAERNLIQFKLVRG